MTEKAIGWWASCDDCEINTVIDGDGRGVPDVGEWDQFPNCMVCGGTLHFDEMPETLWNRENRLMRAAGEIAAAKILVPIEALIETNRGNYADEPDGSPPVVRNYVLISELEAAMGLEESDEPQDEAT